jgi:hypothetical protein
MSPESPGRRAWRRVLTYFGFRQSSKALRPWVTVLYGIVALLWILDAALGSGSTWRWALATAWVVIAGGNVWELRRRSSRRKDQ